MRNAKRIFVVLPLALGWLFATPGCQQGLPELEPLLPPPDAGAPPRPAAPDGGTAAPRGTIDMAPDELRVVLVYPDGPAAAAGFTPGDRLLAGDGLDLTTDHDLQQALEKAAQRKIFFEVKRAHQVLTLPLQTADPGWLVLSADRFHALVVSRLQRQPGVQAPRVGEPLPALELPAWGGGSVRPIGLAGAASAVLFFGTFDRLSEAHLAAFAKACARLAPRGLRCLAVDSLDLFTAVSQTADFAAEMQRLAREVAPELRLAVDLTLAAEHSFGIGRLPSLLLANAGGKMLSLQEGPLPNGPNSLAATLEAALPPAEVPPAGR